MGFHHLRVERAGFRPHTAGQSRQQVLHKHSSVQLEMCNPSPNVLVLLAPLLLLLLKSLQPCLTLCDPIDGSPPGSPVPGILQARTLEWVAIFFSNA